MDMIMGQEKIEEMFYEDPVKRFQIRGIAKEIKMPKSTVKRHIDGLIKKKIVIRLEDSVFPCFKANEGNEIYKFHKRNFMLKKILESGLMEYLEEVCHPSCIVIFGSIAKAEYEGKSDVDIFMQAEDILVDLKRFEKKIKHPINILFEPKISDISDGLFNNIANGIKLSGYLKVR